MNSESVSVDNLTTLLSELHVNTCEESPSVDVLNFECKSAEADKQANDAGLEERLSAPSGLNSVDARLQNPVHNKLELELSLKQEARQLLLEAGHSIVEATHGLAEAMLGLAKAMLRLAEELDTFIEGMGLAIQKG